MAMNRILAQPVAEAEEKFHAFVRMQLCHVLARALDGQRRRHAVARENLVLFKMDVNGVRPIAGGVGQDPMLAAVLLDEKPKMVAVHELAVDGPLAVQPVELECPDDPWGVTGARKTVERLSRGVPTAIDNRRPTHPELQQPVALAGR